MFKINDDIKEKLVSLKDHFIIADAAARSNSDAKSRYAALSSCPGFRIFPLKTSTSPHIRVVGMLLGLVFSKPLCEHRETYLSSQGVFLCSGDVSQAKLLSFSRFFEAVEEGTLIPKGTFWQRLNTLEYWQDENCFLSGFAPDRYANLDSVFDIRLMEVTAKLLEYDFWKVEKFNYRLYSFFFSTGQLLDTVLAGKPGSLSGNALIKNFLHNRDFDRLERTLQASLVRIDKHPISFTQFLISDEKIFNKYFKVLLPEPGQRVETDEMNDAAKLFGRIIENTDFASLYMKNNADPRILAKYIQPFIFSKTIQEEYLEPKMKHYKEMVEKTDCYFFKLLHQAERTETTDLFVQKNNKNLEPSLDEKIPDKDIYELIDLEPNLLPEIKNEPVLLERNFF